MGRSNDQFVFHHPYQAISKSSAKPANKRAGKEKVITKVDITQYAFKHISKGFSLLGKIMNKPADLLNIDIADYGENNYEKRRIASLTSTFAHLLSLSLDNNQNVQNTYSVLYDKAHGLKKLVRA